MHHRKTHTYYLATPAHRFLALLLLTARFPCHILCSSTQQPSNLPALLLLLHGLWLMQHHNRHIAMMHQVGSNAA
jgi:hypothetical protein